MGRLEARYWYYGCFLAKSYAFIPPRDFSGYATVEVSRNIYAMRQRVGEIVRKISESDDQKVLRFVQPHPHKSTSWVQFHQRSTRSFCANSIAPIKCKPKM